jgi:hypothetical protein
MSAIAGFPPRAADGWRRPSFGRLLVSVFAGEFQAALALWVIAIPVGGLGFAPLGGQHDWMWLPWRIDGIWALVGAAGWAYLICALVAWFVAGSLERAGVDLPETGWLRVAIAISGYGGMALGTTSGGRVACAVVLGVILIRVLVLQADGTARLWRWPLQRRGQVLMALAAVLAGFSYGAPHAFVAEGGGGSYGSQSTYVRAGEAQVIDVGLSHLHFGAKLESATLTGPGAANVRVTSMVLSLGNPASVSPPSFLRHVPRRYRSMYTVKPVHFPYSVPAGKNLWLTAVAALRSCGSGTLSTLKLRYTVLGIATTANIPIQAPLTLSCRG